MKRKFYDTIMSLRAAAAMIFDAAIHERVAKEKLADLVKPMHETFESNLALTAKNEPEQVAMAVVMMEKNAGSYMASAEWMHEKADQEMDYAKKLRKALMMHLKSMGVSYLEVEGFLISLSVDGTGVDIR